VTGRHRAGLNLRRRLAATISERTSVLAGPFVSPTSEQKKTRVLIADDHALMREGLKAILSTAPDIEVVAEATDGRAALRLIAEVHPDLVLMDISMPGMNGIEALHVMCERHAEVRVIMLSMHSDAEHVTRALNAGAHGYVLKDAAGTELLNAIRTVRAGQNYLSPAVQHVIRRARAGPHASGSALATLSMRERQVLQLVAEGKSSAEIAALVHLSPKTVETYRSRIMKKLGLRDLTALVRFALKHGITSPD
jgi:DNA-binding NarL/FixJ family response regulator